MTPSSNTAVEEDGTTECNRIPQRELGDYNEKQCWAVHLAAPSPPMTATEAADTHLKERKREGSSGRKKQNGGFPKMEVLQNGWFIVEI